MTTELANRVIDADASAMNVMQDGIVLQQFPTNDYAVQQSLFAQANGYIGFRGSIDEGVSSNVSEPINGQYINGLYSQETIAYGEHFFGEAKTNDQMVCLPDSTYLAIWCNGERVTPDVNASRFSQSLMFDTGLLTREYTWHHSDGTQLVVRVRRFVSATNRHLAHLCFEFISDTAVTLNIASGIVSGTQQPSLDSLDDPRVADLSAHSQTCFKYRRVAEDYVVAVSSVKGSEQTLYQCVNHRFNQAVNKVESSDAPIDNLLPDTEPEYLLHYEVPLAPESSFQFEKHLWNQAMTQQRFGSMDLQWQNAGPLIEATEASFDALQANHVKHWQQKWQTADIRIEGNPEHRQATRFSLFQTLQAGFFVKQTGIGAKGQTGPGYEGHYFWDTEIYYLPMFCYTQPEIARELLMYRVRTLPEAIDRAGELAAGDKSQCQSALFPWRTIGGRECSAFFPAGTAQYHINGAVAHGIKTYFNATADWSFMLEGGLRVLWLTARFWSEIGHFRPADNAFCIDTVTGPDEYTAIVNNNYYTNLLAQQHLLFAIEMYHYVNSRESDAESIISTAGLTRKEIAWWQLAAEHMYLPYSEELNLSLQDDSFLSRKPWDFAATPAENYPLLLHYHPLTIYRHQVCKQADTVLAMVMFPEHFSDDLQQQNLAYYDTITTHDSTLSNCIFSVASARIGQLDKAMNFFNKTIRMDLANTHRNTQHGLHMACMAGAWMTIVYGFAGLHLKEGIMCFKPLLPKGWEGFQFSIRYRGILLKVIIDKVNVTYQLVNGNEINILHMESLVHLNGHNNVKNLLLENPYAK